MKTWWWFPIGLITAALAGYAFAQSRGEQSRPAAADGPANAGESKELRALRRDVEHLKNAARTPVVEYAAAEPARPAAPEPASVGASPKKDRQAAMEAQHRDLVTGLEARFAGERPDGEWSLNTTRAIRGAVATSGPGSQVVEAACGSTLCRLVLSHDTEETQRGLASAVGALEPFRAGIVYDYDLKSTPRKTTLFVLRPGASFTAAE